MDIPDLLKISHDLTVWDVPEDYYVLHGTGFVGWPDFIPVADTLRVDPLDAHLKVIIIFREIHHSHREK